MSYVQNSYHFKTMRVQHAKLYLDGRLALKQAIKKSLELPFQLNLV